MATLICKNRVKTRPVNGNGAGLIRRNKTVIRNKDGYSREQIESFNGKFFYNKSFKIGAKIICVDMDAGDPPEYFYLYLDIPANAEAGTWAIYDYADLKVERIVNYKAIPDTKNFYYFSESQEWVVYHTLPDTARSGEFVPTVGAVICYNENDEEIHPNEIYFCPQIIKDGVIEPAKVIIRWASPQTGKCIFYPGFSANESHDQSRILYNITRNMFNAGFEAVTEWRADFRASHSVTTEPYQTLKSFMNGEIVQYGLITYGDGSDAEKNCIIRLKASMMFFNKLDNALVSTTSNPDIINTIVLSSSNLGDLVKVVPKKYWFFTTYLNHPFRSYSYRIYYLNYSDIPSTAPGYRRLDSGVYAKCGGLIFLDNIGYYYDPDSNKPYNLVLYCHGRHSYVNNEFSFGIAGNWSYNIAKIVPGELLRPLLKVPGMNGYLKIVKKRTGFKPVQSSDGLYEMEYIAEFPCAEGSFDVMKALFVPAAVFKNRSATDTEKENPYFDDRFYYKPTIILEQNSYIRAGGIRGQPNEREAPIAPRSCGKTWLFVSGFELQTYNKNSGGGVYESGAKLNTISYPKEHVYKLVYPDQISQCKQEPLEAMTPRYVTPYKIRLLSGENPNINGQVPINFDAKFLVLADNRKWLYAGGRIESYSGREYPAYVFEMDASALLQDLRNFTKDHYAIPDLKRWILSYCRGYARMINSELFPIDSKSSGSELVLDIWDNKAPTGFNGDSVIMGGNWRSITDSAYDDLAYANPDLEYDNPDNITASGLYDGNSDIIMLSGSWRLSIGSIIGFYNASSESKPVKYYKITEIIQDASYPSNSIYRVSEAIDYTDFPCDIKAFYPEIHINDYRIFKFGGKRMVDQNTKLDYCIDLLGPGIDYYLSFNVDGPSQQSGNISSNKTNYYLSMYGTWPPSFGVTGNGYTRFVDTTAIQTAGEHFMPMDLRQSSSFSVAYQIKCESWETGRTTATIASYDNGSRYLRIYLTVNDGLISVNVDYNFGAADKSVSKVIGPASDEMLYVVISKLKTFISVEVKGTYVINGTLKFSMANTEDGCIMSTFGMGHFNMSTMEIIWRLYKMMVFPNAIVGANDFMVIHAAGAPVYTMNERYINNDNKILFRVRVSKKRAYPVKKSSLNYDDFYAADPFQMGYEPIFDWRKTEIGEEIKRFGVDFFKSFSL